MNRLARLCPDAVDFEYRCIDRLILNAYIPTLQTPGAMAYFLRNVRGKPILSGIVFKQLTDDFVDRTRAFAEKHAVPMLTPPRGTRPGELGQKLLANARKRKRCGVVGVVVHQKRARVFCSSHAGGRATHFRVKEDRRFVNHYYFYIRDPECGEGFVRVCTYPPFATRIWLNGHGFVAASLGRIAEHTTTRFTEAQAVARSTALDRSTFERMVTPSIQDEGKRVAAVRFGTTWAMQLLMALGCVGLCFGAFTAGCAPGRVAIVDHALQTGASHYPVGTDIKSLSESRQKAGGLGPRYVIAGFCDTLQDAFATAALARAKPSTRPTAYYQVFTPRAGAGSSFGAFGMYYDYIFVDANEQVVFAARRQVD